MNDFRPYKCLLKEIKEEAVDTRSFLLSIQEEPLKSSFRLNPGQFVELSVAGYGEAPFSVSAWSESNPEELTLTVKKVGALTEKLFSLSKGDYVGIRGPYGKGFPIELVKDYSSLVIIAGGIGLAPVRPVIRVMENKDFRANCSVTVIAGAKSPSDLLFREETEKWETSAIKAIVTVDNPDNSWSGSTGVVTQFIPDLDMPVDKTLVFVCGPPVMYPFVISSLEKKNISHKNIFISYERYMKCGIGNCGHCHMDNKYVCIDGPVFCYEEAKTLRGHHD